MKLEKLVLVKSRPNQLKLNSNLKIETVIYLFANKEIDTIQLVLLTDPALLSVLVSNHQEFSSLQTSKDSEQHQSKLIASLTS